MRQFEQFKKVAANFENMAQDVNDQALRNLFSRFAQQWRDAAQVAEFGKSKEPKDTLANSPSLVPDSP
jgi:hypothetical protein